MFNYQNGLFHSSIYSVERRSRGEEVVGQMRGV